MDAFEFFIEKTEEGRYIARSWGACMMTSADTIEELRQHIKEAVCCHFDEGCEPAKVRLRFVEVVREECVELCGATNAGEAHEATS